VTTRGEPCVDGFHAALELKSEFSAEVCAGIELLPGVAALAKWRGIALDFTLAVIERGPLEEEPWR
jgi:hypothetical protein